MAIPLALVLGASATAAPAYRPPRTAWGAPSLEGEWTNLSATKLERPAGFTRPVIGEAEARAYEDRITKEATADAPAGDIGQSQSEWRQIGRLSRVTGGARTAWLTTPADGHLPWRPEALAQHRREAAGVLDDPETLTASDRCLSPGWSAVGPPMLNAPYNAQYLIIQAQPGVVSIFSEALHEVRSIRIGGRPAPADQRLWMGDSIGRWEGDTLVVESTTFHPADAYRSPLFLLSPDAKVTERFTRVAPHQIRYRFTVDDPAHYTRPWSGEEPFTTTSEPLYEYACAEGNYALAGMLAGARREEAQARAKVASARGGK